jgi:hypothetical protein
LAAEVTIERLAPGRVRIAVREGLAGIVQFVVFVALIAVALYALMPEARARPAPLLGLVIVALGWAGIARRAREEYVVDESARSVTARRMGLLEPGEDQVNAPEISAVRLARSGVDDDRLVVELLGPHRQVRLRLPRRVTTLTARDQSDIGRLVAEHLGVPLQAG